MRWLEQVAKVEIVTVSGILRVTMQPSVSAVTMLFQAVVLIAFGWIAVRDWVSLSFATRSFLLWGILADVVAWFFQLSGSEVIELDAENLTLSKSILGWDSVSKYRTMDCSELVWNEHTAESDECGLSCKVGWRIVRFGKYLSEKQAIEILTELQRGLPEVAQVICRTSGSSKEHFTTLGLG